MEAIVIGYEAGGFVTFWVMMILIYRRLKRKGRKPNLIAISILSICGGALWPITAIAWAVQEVD